TNNLTSNGVSAYRARIHYSAAVSRATPATATKIRFYTRRLPVPNRWQAATDTGKTKTGVHLRTPVSACSSTGRRGLLLDDLALDNVLAALVAARLVTGRTARLVHLRAELLHLVHQLIRRGA